MPISGGAQVLTEALRVLDDAQIGIDDVGLRRPTLDDVFLSLTGHASEEDGRRQPDRTAPLPPDTPRDTDRTRPARGHRPVLHRRCLMAAPTVFSDSYVVAKRNIIKIKRVPDLLVFTTLSPIMFVLLFAFVFGGAIAVPGGTDPDAYREFLMAGIFAQTVIFGATITGAGLAEDVKKGIIDRFRSLPMAPSAVLTGRTISDVANNVLVLIVMSLTGLLVGWAHPQLAGRGGARLPAAADLRLRGLVDHGVARHAGAQRRGVQQRHVHRDLPAHVRGQHLRPAGDAARSACRRSRSGTRSRR